MFLILNLSWCYVLLLFLQTYGCTGWTDEVLDTIIELAKNRGIVEMGAGNGPWARAITDRYNEQAITERFENRYKKFDFVLAYDDMSDIPVKPIPNNNNIQQMIELNRRLKQYQKKFHYDNVQSCDSNQQILKDFKCRGRVLLLVYPSPNSDMAYINATKQYVEAGSGGNNNPTNAAAILVPVDTRTIP